MKKIFFSALAVLSLAACVQEQVMDVPSGGAIEFQGAFVENATRADVIDNSNLKAFQVWGYVNSPDGTVFNGQTVSIENGSWQYTGGTQYWAPGQEYTFAAVAPVTDKWTLTMETTKNSARTLAFDNDGNTDLIYAKKTVVSASAGNKNDAVELAFNHLLSKVKLSFTNGFPTNATVALTNIQMETPKNASIDLAATTPAWTVVDQQSLVFSAATLDATKNAEVGEYFIVPAKAVISFDLAVSVGSEEVYTGSKTATIPTIAFEMGHAYNLSAVIDAAALDFDEIKFTVDQVVEWVPAGDASDDAANLIYAAQVGGVITLEEDVVLDAPVVVPAGVELVLNLNGNTIKNTTQSEVYGEGEGIIAYGNLTINGEGTVEGSTMAVWARGNKGAKVTINGGTYKGCAGDFEGGRSVIYASSGNIIDIYGGTFEALAADETSFAKTEYPVLNVADNNGMINVYGGTFVGQNPAAPGTEPAAWNAAHPNGFVAPGYASVETAENVWTVGYDAATTTADLQARINAGQAHIYLAANTTFEGTVVMKSGVTIEGLAGATMHNINLNGANGVTIKNIKFDAANAAPCADYDGRYKMYANIMTGMYGVTPSNKLGAHNLVIDGCSFTGSFKTGKPGTAIAFADYHRTTGYSGNITIKNCTFDTVVDAGGYDIYGYYVGDETNGHGDFVIEKNTFKSSRGNGCTIGLFSYCSNTPIVVKNNVFEKDASIDDAITVTTQSYSISIHEENNTFAN